MGGASLVPVQMWEGRARPRCNAVVGGCVYNDMPFPDGPLKAAAVGSVWGGEVQAFSDAAGRLPVQRNATVGTYAAVVALL